MNKPIKAGFGMQRPSTLDLTEMDKRIDLGLGLGTQPKIAERQPVIDKRPQTSYIQDVADSIRDTDYSNLDVHQQMSIKARKKRNQSEYGLRSYRKFPILNAIDRGNKVTIGITSHTGIPKHVVEQLVRYYYQKNYVVRVGKRGRYHIYDLSAQGKAFVEWHRANFG